ncbi:hypothetical protein [Streptomyces kanamyceticus]|uniref:hypothetical protein n=1 Tax=Streptomyces kanamyceticus TaxID=1967 RepID=UPI00123D6E8D|nr:hypothetical protein [Streptomyces kanamyceticus]
MLHSLLLAQLVANRKVNRFTEAENWYEVFGETLESIGWIVESHEGFVRHRASAFPYRVDAPALAALGGISDGPALGLAAAALRELSGLSADDRALQLFEEYGQFGGRGNFQVAVAEVDTEAADGLLAVRLGRFRFRVEDPATVLGRLLRTDFHAGDVFFRGAQTLRLNEEVYGPLRDGIAAKLGARVEALIAAVGGEVA